MAVTRERFILLPVELFLGREADFVFHQEFIYFILFLSRKSRRAEQSWKRGLSLSSFLTYMEHMQEQQSH